MNRKLATLAVILIVLLPVGICFCETFGETGTGDSTWTAPLNDRKIGSIFTLSEEGTITKISFRMGAAWGGWALVKAGIYNVSDGVPNGLEIECEEQNITETMQFWNWTSGDLPKALSAADYWIGVIIEGAGNQRIRRQSNAGDNVERSEDDYTDGFEETFGTPENMSDYHVCAFATYTPSVGEEEYIFGAISPQFTVESQKTVSFNRYNTISQIFVVASQKSVAFTLLSSINQIFTLSSYTNIAQNVINVFATIGQLFSITSYRTWSYSITSTVGLVWTLGSTVTATILRNVFGVIGQVFSVASHRTTSFLIDSIINQVFTIQSTVTMPGLVNIHATIDAVIGFLSHAAFTTPVEYATKGFVLACFVVALLIGMPLGALIIARRRP